MKANERGVLFMKKSLFIITLLLVLCLFTGCKETNLIPKAHAKDTDIIGFSALTSVNFLGTNEIKNVRQAKQVTDEQMVKINQYLQMMDEVLSNDTFEVLEEVSDKSEYQVKLVFSSKNLAGETSQYVIYYNQTIESDDDDGEEEYTISGIAISGETTYQLTGEKELEDEEFELELKVTLDDENYCIIEQEIEDDEVDYVYSIYKNNKLFSKISLEQEDDELEVKFISNNDGIKESYSFKKESEKNQEVIKIKYHSNSEVVNIKVKSYFDEELGETIYHYTIVETNEEHRFQEDD